MAIKPKIEESQIDLYRGTGKLGSELDYLKVDPTTYFYNKLKKSSIGNLVRDDMWTEASIRGETNVLANVLSQLENISKNETIDTTFLDKYEFYENQGMGDYDTYMLALSLPMLDNTEKEQYSDDLTGYEFGSFTKREWAEQVLTSTFQRYDAEIIEQEKANASFWDRMWTEIGVGAASGLLNIVSGVSTFVNDIFNIGQGLLNICVNWSSDTSAGDRFLWAFANDENDENVSNQLAQLTEELSYRLQYEYSGMVNAVEAYEHGYIPGSWGELNTPGEKVYQGFGTFWNGATNAIGYMLPSIIAAIATGGVGAAPWVVKLVGSVTMYTGIASGNIKDTVQRASMNGISYKDLNAGSVISNAIIKAAAQYGVEVALGKILGFFSISDKLRGLGDDSVKAASKIGATESRAMLTAVGRGIKGMAKEGLEEALQDLSDGIIDTFYGVGGTELNQIYRERGVETMSLDNLIQAFVAGALTEGMVGSVHSIKFLGSKNRFFGEDGKGNAYKMGMFQSMNFAQSLAAMNEWNDTLKNANATKEEKAAAAYRISTTMKTVGEVLSSFGQSDAIKTNNLLLADVENKAKQSSIKKLSDTEYAKDLYNTFVKSYSEVVSKYNKVTQDSQKEGLFEKVKKFFNKNAKELKESGTTEVNNVITEKLDINSPDLTMNKDTASKLKGILKDLGAVALIGVDGNIITKSEDIVAINNDILESGDIAEIVRDIAYQQVRDTVKTKLSQTQKKRILNTYRKLVGREAALEEAVTALLFDKNFYTKVLLMTEEKTRTDKLEAVKMLATIDNLIKTKSADLLKNGSLTDSAYKTLLKKVYETMRTGLIVYATHYARLDLGSISNDILASDIKQEITNHRNVIFSTKMDKGINGEILNDQDLTDFDNYVDKFNTQFNAEEIANLKRKARSTNSNDRRDAYRTLILAAKANNYKSVNDKIVYIPASSDGIVDEENIRAFEEFVGVQFKQLIDGTYDANDLTHHAKNMICPGYDKGQTAYRYNMDDKDARINFARELLFTISKSLTVGADGTILKVIEKDDFIKDEYLGKEGDTKFKQDLQKGKITKISDVSKIKLPKALGDVKVIYDSQLGSINGHFDESVNAIRANYTINTISMMHEITHATQYYTKAGADSTLGGKVEMFELLPQDTLNELDKYISTNFPMSYTFLSNHLHLNTPNIIYCHLEGELQAFSTASSHAPDLGFKWKKDKTELWSPDGKEHWPMKASQSKLLKARQQEFKQQIKETTAAMAEEMKAKKKPSKFNSSEDISLATDSKGRKLSAEQQEFFKDSKARDENGNLLVLYHGTKDGRFDKFEKNKLRSGAGFMGLDIDGFYFTDNEREAIGFSGKNTRNIDWSKSDIENGKLEYGDYTHPHAEVKEVYLNMKNPLIVDQFKSTVYSQINKYIKENLKPEHDGVIFKSPTTMDEYIVFNSNQIKLVNNQTPTESERISEDKPLTPEEKEKEKQREYYRARHISNKVAQESNLRYWIKKGVPIQINPGIAQFVVNTTNDFENLPKVLQDKIKNATLTKFDIIDYISTHTNIKNFTFKAIAKYVYNSPELAKISYSEMTDLIDNIDIIVAAASVPNGLNPDKILSPKEMIAQAKEIAQNAEATPETARQYRKALNYAEIMKVGTRKDGSPIFTDVTADPKQMNIMFFNHYDGTPNSLKNINALGKNLALKQQEEGYDDNGVRKTSSSTWNYTAKKREATEDEGDIYDYKDSTLGKALDEIDKVDKINTIAEYIQNTIAERIRKEMDLGKVDMDYVRAMTKKIDSLVNSLHDLSEDELNAKYLEATEREMAKEHPIEPITKGLDKVDISTQPSSISNIKNGIRNAGTAITKLLNRLPDSYDKLPDNIKLAFDEKTLKLKLDSYSKLSRDELIKFKNDLLNIKADLSAQSKEISKAVETKQTLEKKVERLQKQNERLKAEIENQKRMKEEARTDKQTLREKLNSGIKYRTTIRQQEFNFTNNTEPTKLVTNLLNTSWTKTKMSTVQGVVSNKEEIVANGKKFFEENAVALLSSDLAEIEQTVDWFINAKMNEATDTDYKKFVAVKGYFLAWVLSQTRPSEAFANMNSNLKQKIDSAIREMGSTSGTLLAILNNMKEYINPMMAMASADIELDGVKIDGELKDQLFRAIESGKVEEMQKAQQAILDYVANNRTTKKSFYRKAVTLRSMSMLSSPLTWLRNIISNIILKPLHKFTDKIGSNIFKSKTDAGQLKLNKQVTPEIQKFITQHFIDNKFFDTFINNLSKYNPSDIKDKQKTPTGLPTKEAIYTNLVLKSMYNQYYNDNMFNKDKKTGKFMNGLYHKLMKVMSDDKYVREAAIRYFGKLLAEHNADISSGQINDNVMNDLSTAIGLAMNDYMHSNNIFNDIEKAIMERGEGYWFLYKTILPFASSSWNWFKAAMRMTPLGLAKSIVDITKLEKRIAKAKLDWEAGKSQISPELTEFMIRRNLGAGVIGTVAFIFGAILSGLGVMSLEDDDYGVPKLRVGNVVVDVSSIFGTSSVLAGAAFANGIKEQGWGKDGWLTGLNNMVDVWLDDMPIMEIVEMDMYADGGFSMGLKNLESIALSYIPNFLSYFAGLHKGTIKKDTFWKRAIAKIPFLNWTLETRVDPYTGGEGSWADAIGRIVPFFSLDTASQNEKKSRQLGLNKKELNGTYKINGQDFNVSGKDLQEINKAYGLWNAEDLTKFYDNQLRVKVKVSDNKYKELTYNQMTNEQRKNAVQTIMSNNAELAKIMAWTKAGNKYYGSANTYATLKKRGIKTNVYKGTKGFVKSK